jgi:hypothetical protein
VLSTSLPECKSEAQLLRAKDKTRQDKTMVGFSALFGLLDAGTAKRSKLLFVLV